MAQETKDKDSASKGDLFGPPDEAGSSRELVRAESSDGLSDVDGSSLLVDGELPAAAANLGVDRYVLAGFFAAGMLAAYVLGRALHAVWSAASTKDWFSQVLPAIAAVTDDDKSVYSTIVGGVVAFVLVYRTYKRPDIRVWSDDVAAELAKVVWPTRKDVSNSTFIVIVASTVATLYLTVLDRLWAFVTNIVYGDGS